MKTQSTISTRQHLLPPALMVKQLLLTERTKVTTVRPAITPEQIQLQATTITVVLQRILHQPGYRHGGLNE